MKIIGVIPARYESSRFPGKPLADINGKPMIWWVYQQCIKVEELNEVYVATDDQRIYDTCQKLDIQVVMTSTEHRTGTDRIGEVAEKIPADLYVNIQGDEPMLEPNTIRAAIFPFYQDKNLQISNLMTKIKDPVDAINCTVPKVITNREGMGIFLTRSMAPYPKGSINYSFYKQVCVYGFTPEALKFYCEYGKKYGKAKIEEIEDIEILRFIENGYKVQYIEVDSDTVAVDTEKDLEKVRILLTKKNENPIFKDSELEGKMVWRCTSVGQRINFDGHGYSFCHFFEVGKQSIPGVKELTPERYYEAVYNKIIENEDPTSPCRKCSQCKHEEYHRKPIVFVTVCTSSYCNSNCVYCGVNGKEGDGYNPIKYLKQFHTARLFDTSCLFDWGGGEPTLNPFFEETVDWINRQGYRQRINTNAIIFSEATNRALIEKKASLRISIDAGSREVFRRVKGNEYYDTVWENVKKYATVSNEVYLKYNIFDWNSKREEADLFLQKCRDSGVQHIWVESEHASYSRLKNVGPLFFGDKELEFAKYLFEKGKDKGFEMLIADGFRDRDPERKRAIPDKLNSNVDTEVLKNGITCQTFARVDWLMEAIGSRSIVIWGAGIFGKTVLERMLNANKKVSYIVDSNEKLYGMRIRGIEVVSPEQAYLEDKDAVVILAGEKYAEMLRTINENNWKEWNGNIYYLLLGKYMH